MDKIKQLIADANKKHELGLAEADTHFYNGELYISTTKAGQFFHASFHVFTNFYVPAITKEGMVRRIITGKAKWYSLDDLEGLMDKAIKQNKSVYDLCKIEKRKSYQRKASTKRGK